jgi:uncharacterized protein YjiS (DUF1127 family)
MFASLHTATFATRTIGSRRKAAKGSLWSRLGIALAVYRQRQALATLDDHMLRDLGLSHDAALAEASRPLWDMPRQWQK